MVSRSKMNVPALVLALVGALAAVSASPAVVLGKRMKMAAGGADAAEFEIVNGEMLPILFNPDLWYLYRDEHRKRVLPPGWLYRVKEEGDVEFYHAH